MPTNKDVLISGASIAGPALAYWLRNRGFNPTVVERAPAPRPGGQAVDLRGAGRTVVERMGLMDRVRAVGLDQRGLAFVDASGRVTARMPTELFGGDLRRGEEANAALLERLGGFIDRKPAHAEVVTGGARVGDRGFFFAPTVITGLEQDDAGVSVTFENAAPRRFGLVVGADGLHSAVRGLAFGPEPECVRPLGCYTAWFTAPAEFDLGGWFLMHNAPGGRVVSARPGRGDVAAQQDTLARRFAGAGWQTPRLLAAMRDAPDFFFDSMGQVRLDRWSSGRAVLLGDAGYCPTPLTGLGTSLALVGAYVLVGELARADGDHAAAFRRYEDLMRPYVARGQQLPPGGVPTYAPNRQVVIRLRTASMRWMTRWPLRAVLASQFAKAGDITLPGYEPSPSPAQVTAGT